MAITKSHANKGFVIVPNKSAQDNRLSLKARGLHHYLLSLPSDWEFTIQSLAKQCKEGKDALRTAFNELMELKYILRIRKQDWEYHVYPVPFDEFPTSENRTFDFPTSDFPTSDFPTSDFPTTYKYINKQINKKTNKEKDNNLLPDFLTTDEGECLTFELTEEGIETNGSQLSEGIGDLSTPQLTSLSEIKQIPLTANKNPVLEENNGSGSTHKNTTIDNKQWENLAKKSVKRWTLDEKREAREFLSPFVEIWNQHKKPYFATHRAIPVGALPHLLELFLLNGEESLSIFEKAVKFIASDTKFWIFPATIENLCSNGKIESYSAAYLESPNGQSINSQQIKEAERRKKSREMAQMLAKTFNYTGDN